MEKIYIVLQESNVDGAIIINATPCATLKAARKVMEDEVKLILTESHHFSGYTEEEMNDMFEVEKDPDSFYINDPSDDYYEVLNIHEKELVK
jgi:hypothetical protein